MKVALKRSVIAAPTVLCAVLLSFTWSEQRSVSLGVESAQAADRVARREYRRSDRGYELFADAVASTTSPWNYDDYLCYDGRYTGRGYAPGDYYRSYPGGYCISRGYATRTYARPTLFPRYYNGW